MLTKNLQADVGLMVINFRNRIDGLTSDLAGNYENMIGIHLLVYCTYARVHEHICVAVRTLVPVLIPIVSMDQVTNHRITQPPTSYGRVSPTIVDL